MYPDCYSFCGNAIDLGLEAKLVRVTVTDAEVEDYEQKALAFLREVDLEVNAVRTMADVEASLKASQAVA